MPSYVNDVTCIDEESSTRECVISLLHCYIFYIYVNGSALRKKTVRGVPEERSSSMPPAGKVTLYRSVFLYERYSTDV